MKFIHEHPVLFTVMVMTGLLGTSSALIARFATEKAPAPPPPPAPAK